MALEKVTLKNVKVTLNFDIDPETFNLLEQQVKTDLKKSYVTDSDHPHLRRIK